MPILELICRPPIRFWAWLPRRKEPTPRSLFAELQDPVRQMFRRSGLLDRVGESHLFATVDDGVQDYLKRHPAASHANVA
jgi:oligoribonuclease (3'-5' exoribonuclease)